MVPSKIAPGDQFHYLTVVKQEPSTNCQRMWFCQCKCGGTHIVSSNRLLGGKVKSCGCYRKERGIEHGAKVKLRHGNARGNGSREYQVWNAMKMRCTNPKHKQYSYYGGRGITVCEKWLTFEGFLADMGRRPEGERYSLDRIDNSKGYYKENCRWATPKQQNNNTRFNRMITLRNSKQVSLQFALDSTETKRTEFYNRLRKGWTELQACGLESRDP